MRLDIPVCVEHLISVTYAFNLVQARLPVLLYQSEHVKKIGGMLSTLHIVALKSQASVAQLLYSKSIVIK